jgi:Transglycosylase SLT domain
MDSRRKILPTFLRAMSLMGSISLSLAWSSADAKPSPESGWQSRVCGMVVSAAEEALQIPDQLLAAIARVESGRWLPEKQANFAWPWTVTAEGEGHYYPTKAEAIAAVTRFREQGITNIDVGCLQVNLQYHPQAFESLEAAFDPMENTIYAAKLLTTLHDGSRNWTDAVARYHSANPSARLPYVDKVSRLWRDEHRRKALADHERLRRRVLEWVTQEAQLAENDAAPSNEAP